MEPLPQYALLPSDATNGLELWTFDLTTQVPAHSATCSRIFDFLYLGGYQAAENAEWLQKMRVTCVINVRKDPVENEVHGIEYINIEVDDDEYEPIHWYFDDTVAKIEVSYLFNCL